MTPRIWGSFFPALPPKWIQARGWYPTDKGSWPVNEPSLTWRRVAGIRGTLGYQSDASRRQDLGFWAVAWRSRLGIV